MSNVAQCPECNKKYKVPHLDKAWQCKVCQVPLTLPGASADLPESEVKPQARQRPKRPAKPKKLVSTECPKCGAVVAGERSECNECGASIGEDPYASPKHSGRPAHKRAVAGSRESMEQSAARGAAKKELRKLDFLRFLIKVGLFWTVLAVLGGVGQLSNTEDMLATGISLAISLGIFWFLWSTHRALKTIYGRPRPFVFVLACMYTLLVLLADSRPEKFISGLWASMYWMFVATLSKIEAIKEENPAAFADPEQVRSIAADEKLHRRRMAEAARSAKVRNRRLLILGGISGIVLLGVFGYKAMNRPETPDAVIQSFQASWNKGDFSAVASLATPGRRAAWLKKLKRRDKQRGWDGRPPVLDKALIESQSETSVRVAYPTEDGSLGVRFGLEGKVWILKSLNYSDLP